MTILMVQAITETFILMKAEFLTTTLFSNCFGELQKVLQYCDSVRKLAHHEKESNSTLNNNEKIRYFISLMPVVL